MTLGTGGHQPQREVLHAATLAQSEYSRPDDRYGIGRRRFWRRKKKVEEAPELTAPESQRAERQRRLMMTGDAEPEGTDSGEQA